MRRRLLLVILGLAAAVVGAWLAFNRSTARPPASAAPDLGVSALVQTARPRQITLVDSLTAFGEVTTGQVVAISFPRAGQVARLIVVPGQRVQRGVLLATLASDPNSMLAYTQAVSAADFARGELRRNEELFALQLSTESQVDAARKSLQDAEANLATQRAIGGDIGVARVTAPFEGVVTSVAVAQGDRIQPGATLLQLGHIDVLRVRLGIEPVDFHLVRVGQPVTLEPVDDPQHLVKASITEAQGLVDPKTQLVDALAEISADRKSFLVPGLHMRASIEVGRRSTWAVPRAAVLTDAGGSYLFQVAEGRARRVNVTRGEESQGLVAVSGPFDASLPVVSIGNYELQEGMPVREGGP
jgi:membrane fusion protein, multidrug efflux system